MLNILKSEKIYFFPDNFFDNMFQEERSFQKKKNDIKKYALIEYAENVLQET